MSKTVADILQDVTDSICDNYCKWPDIYAAYTREHDDDDTKLLKEKCGKCPLNKLI